MNTQQLRCFLAVAENLSFARAAEEVFLTQPTVTHQINSLENELGVKLFHRTKRTVSLTQEGMIFYDDAKGILLKEQAALHKLRFHNTQEDPVLGVGVASAEELRLLVPALAALTAERSFRPNMRILPLKSMWSMFCNSDLDCILSYQGLYPESPRIRETPIRETRIVCALSIDHPLARAGRISQEQICGERFLFCSPAALPAVAATVENELLPLFSPNRVIYCETIEATVALARFGFGIAVLPENLCAAREDIASVPFDTGASLVLCMFSKKDIAANKLDILRELQKLLAAPQKASGG